MKKKEKRFLIVDDSRIARNKIINFTESMGYKCLDEAEDGLKALEKFKENDYTYIVMDLEMPNMKGSEAAKKILELKPDINIILITSIVDKKELLYALRIGIKKILKKPVSFEVYENTINQLEKKDRNES